MDLSCRSDERHRRWSINIMPRFGGFDRRGRSYRYGGVDAYTRLPLLPDEFDQLFCSLDRKIAC